LRCCQKLWGAQGDRIDQDQWSIVEIDPETHAPALPWAAVSARGVSVVLFRIMS
jgi:hypothetical protein